MEEQRSVWRQRVGNCWKKEKHTLLKFKEQASCLEHLPVLLSPLIFLLLLVPSQDQLLVNHLVNHLPVIHLYGIHHLLHCMGFKPFPQVKSSPSDQIIIFDKKKKKKNSLSHLHLTFRKHCIFALLERIPTHYHNQSPLPMH